ncbi:outer membrane beta-barrel protein [Halobacteriovorax sp. JY17]|uniref:outer membrane beta-barrel protein n=1 Tax=Halobacteriovorax sp. JY17 TaxID=2014617 RepID=UPI000C3EADE8|nr:outer membrane beta-barrel protein [Halobacteriovorax sp. JY17]PIK15916.1 MAG: hypothetical protein CES88_04095 [Halobacteriovorax sp. JY17]
MKNIKIISLFSLLLFTSQSFAGVLVEPFLGFGIGSGEYVSGAQTADNKYTGPQFGARLGYTALGFMGGLEYRKTSGSLSYDKHSGGGVWANSGTDQDYSGTEIGAFIGYELPILLRAYVGYTFNTKWELDKNGTWIGAANDELSGNTTTLGVGFTGLPFVSLNVEFRMIELDKYKNVSAGTETSADYSSNEVVLGVSLPLDL